jgi:acyl-coenzyme A thioesterase PaaI-like protein
MGARATQTLGLVMAGVLASMLISYCSSAQQRPAAAPATATKAAAAIVGTWHVSFTRPPGRGYALVTFTSDGTSVRTTDRSPVMSPSHGAWQQTGEREFQATWHAFKFDASGAHVGNQKAIFRVTVSEDGNSLAGAGVGTTYTLDGKLIESETAEGPFEGTRIAIVEHYNK